MIYRFRVRFIERKKRRVAAPCTRTNFFLFYQKKMIFSFT